MLVDSHCHLADQAFVEDLPEVVARAQDAGLAKAMCILSADEPAEVERAAVVRAAWPAIEFAAAVHPHRAGAYAGRAAEAAEVTRQAARTARAVAIGEIGLDYHYNFAPRDVQREVFAHLVELAVELDKPVVIHTREATADTFAILREAGRGRIRGVLHCFSGTLDDARQGLDLGFYISIAGIVTFPKAENVRQAGAFVPAERLLVETDAPFLAPVPHRGKRNEPAWIVETVKRLAQEKESTVAALTAQIAHNFAALTGVRA